MKSNIFDPDFDLESDRNGFRSKRAYLGRQSGSVNLGASLFELKPGESPFPFHFHCANEEMLIVLQGRPHLREPGGWRELNEGEVVAFPVGEEHPHQIQNHSDETVRVLMVSEMKAPEVGVYPDSGKVGVLNFPPGSEKEGLRHYSRLEDGVGYADDESPPAAPAG